VYLMQYSRLKKEELLKQSSLCYQQSNTEPSSNTAHK